MSPKPLQKFKPESPARGDEADPATVWLDLEYSLAAADNGLGNGETKFAPTGYADMRGDERMAVYTTGDAAKPARASPYGGPSLP